MRTLIAIFLSLFLSLNAASAAVHGVCDAFEQGAAHGVGVAVGHDGHPGHHDDSASLTVHSESHSGGAMGDPENSIKTHTDHCHVHPSVSSLLPVALSFPVQTGRAQLIPLPAAALSSAQLPRLDRPPIARLA